MCVFSVYSSIYRASMPIASNGAICGALDGDTIYVGGGDGKVKKVVLTAGQWTLTHEAQLDSMVQSINLNIAKDELIVGTKGGQLYRVLSNDLSYILHSDAHTGKINDVAFGPNDSNTFVSIDENGSGAGRLQRVHDLHTPNKTSVHGPAIAFHDDVSTAGVNGGAQDSDRK